MGDMDASLYLLFKAIRAESTVALSGESADEIFGGYRQFHDPVTQRRLAPEKIARHFAADHANRAASFGVSRHQEPTLGHAHAAGVQIFIGRADDKGGVGAAILVFH